MTLSNKQRVFIDEYLKIWNATEAARRSGYSHPNKQGPRLLVNVGISAEIRERLTEIHMSANEALKLTADIGRGDMADFVNDFGMIDISQARKNGKTKLIKKWRSKTITINGKDEDREIHTEEIELYSADAAQNRILRVHGKYKDAGTEANPLIVHVKKIGISMEDL